MCGRFTLRSPASAVASHFGLESEPELTARFNIAPGQAIVAVRAAEGVRVAEPRIWGLVPEWAASPSLGQRLINARAETAAEKPAFRSAFRRRRCLIPADGFYEWAPGTPHKQPYHIARADGAVFGFAGLWASWRGEDARTLESCTVLTTAADASLEAIHARMPVILPPERYAAWLDPEQDDPAALRSLLASGEAPRLVARPVGRRVNDVRHDDPECLAPAPPQGEQVALL